MLVALTGGIGSGKSTVADLFAKHGAIVIKADELAREVTTRGGRAFDSVLEKFGTSILNSEKEIDRKKLATLVFNDPEQLAELEKITHPAVQAELADRVAKLDPDAIVIYEIPLLIEKGLFAKFDKSISVISDLELRRERTINRGLTSADFDARVKNQTTDEKRIAQTQIVIYNNGSMDELAEQVESAWRQLTA